METLIMKKKNPHFEEDPEKFRASVHQEVEELRAEKEYEQMKLLGIYAAKQDPLGQWETVTLEALQETGSLKEARQFYRETMELYLEEQGFCPADQERGMVQKLRRQMCHGRDTLEEIRRELAEEKRLYPGGYLCPYPVFSGIWHMLQTMPEQNMRPASLLLCTLTDEEGKPVGRDAGAEEAAARLGEAIRRAVRISDVITQYRPGQYLVLLVNAACKDCPVIQRRITKEFDGEGKGMFVWYEAAEAGEGQKELPLET